MLRFGAPDSRFRSRFPMSPISGNTDSRFRWGFLMNSAFWQYRFAFSLRISNELCVLAPQIRVFAEDFWWILRSGNADSCFRFGFPMNSAFWRTTFAFSLGISNEFCVLVLQIQVFAKDFQSIMRSGISDSCFRWGFLMNSEFWQKSARRGPWGFEDAAH